MNSMPKRDMWWLRASTRTPHEQLPHTHTRTHLWMRVCIHRGTRVGYSFVLLRQTGKMAAIETSGECKYPVIVLKVLAVLWANSLSILDITLDYSFNLDTNMLPQFKHNPFHNSYSILRSIYPLAVHIAEHTNLVELFLVFTPAPTPAPSGASSAPIVVAMAFNLLYPFDGFIIVIVVVSVSIGVIIIIIHSKWTANQINNCRAKCACHA